MDKKISKFPTHFDNIKESVKASDINSLGSAINNAEDNIIKLADENFSDKVFFTLENSKKANALFLDKLENTYKIFQSKTENVLYNQNESSLSLKPESSILEGTVQSIFFKPEHPTRISEVALMVDDYIPKGAAIYYFISIDGEAFFPIRPNVSELLQLAKSGQGIYIKAKLVKNRNFESPKIYGWATLYRDPILERLYGIQNYDLSRFDQELVGETILIRDRTNDDRIVMVVDPLTSTELFYDADHDNRLSHTIERVDDRVIKEAMNYGEYFNSSGEHEEVLLGTSKELITDDDVIGEIPEKYFDKLAEIVDNALNQGGGS